METKKIGQKCKKLKEKEMIRIRKLQRKEIAKRKKKENHLEKRNS
jgi:hypothetical protein